MGALARACGAEESWCGDLVKRAQRMDENELARLGIEALFGALGPAAALRFLSLLKRGHGDSVEMSRRLYEDQTIEEVHARAKQNWRG